MCFTAHFLAETRLGGFKFIPLHSKGECSCPTRPLELMTDKQLSIIKAYGIDLNAAALELERFYRLRAWLLSERVYRCPSRASRR